MDVVWNRLVLQTGVCTTTYLYDDANRLTLVNWITYTWDANGDLLSDGIIESLKDMKPLRRRKVQ
jgi:hypothetical protein